MSNCCWKKGTDTLAQRRIATNLQSVKNKQTKHKQCLQSTTMPAKSLQLCPTLFDPTDCIPARLLYPWNSLGKNTGVGCHSFLQRTFPTQGFNLSLLCLLYWQVDPLPLNHLESLCIHAQSSGRIICHRL